MERTEVARPASLPTGHLYPSSDPLRVFPGVIPYPSWQSLPEIAGKVDAWRPDLPILITEAGYTTEETPSARRAPPSARRSRPRGSGTSSMSRSSPRAASRRSSGSNFQDNPGWPAGLLRHPDGPLGDVSGIRKPSYDAFLDVVAVRGAVPPP